jgi:alpha-L-fucosidase 2
MEWKDGKLTKLVVRSRLGGNLRLRAPNELRAGSGLRPAMGVNKNTFYQTEEIPAAIISAEAKLADTEMKRTFLYDIDTRPGTTYTILSN